MQVPEITSASLLPDDLCNEIVDEVFMFFSAIKKANTPLDFSKHPLFKSESLVNPDGQQIERPKEFDKLVLALLKYFGDYYSFPQIQGAVYRAANHIRHAPTSPPPKRTARELVMQLSNPKGNMLLESATFYVPLSGILIQAPLDLGYLTILPPNDARKEIKRWRKSSGYDLGPVKLERVQSYGGVYARIAIAKATEAKQELLLAQKLEAGVNFLRYWQHHIRDFDQFRNRPHIGKTPPTVNATGLRANGISDWSLYFQSVSGTPITSSSIAIMNNAGFADTIGWQQAPTDTARFTIVEAIQNFGHAWSHTNIEDRVMASFRAFEGWLRRDYEPHIGATLARRLRILTGNDWASPKLYADEFCEKIYGPIRSAITHGRELPPSYLSWVDRIITDMGVKAVRCSVPIIRSEHEQWANTDFHAKLDAL